MQGSYRRGGSEHRKILVEKEVMGAGLERLNSVNTTFICKYSPALVQYILPTIKYSFVMLFLSRPAHRSLHLTRRIQSKRAAVIRYQAFGKAGSFEGL